MALQRTCYQNEFYYFDINKPNFYFFDEENQCHIIIYTIYDYCGCKYTAEWRIPGTSQKDIHYAMRLALKLTLNNLTVF